MRNEQLKKILTLRALTANQFAINAGLGLRGGAEVSMMLEGKIPVSKEVEKAANSLPMDG